MELTRRQLAEVIELLESARAAAEEEAMHPSLAGDGTFESAQRYAAKVGVLQARCETAADRLRALAKTMSSPDDTGAAR